MQKRTGPVLGGGMGGADFGKAQKSMQGMMDIYGSLGGAEPKTSVSKPAPVKSPVPSKNTAAPARGASSGIAIGGSKAPQPKATPTQSVSGQGYLSHLPSNPPGKLPSKPLVTQSPAKGSSVPPKAVAQPNLKPQQNDTPGQGFLSHMAEEQPGQSVPLKNLDGSTGTITQDSIRSFCLDLKKRLKEIPTDLAQAVEARKVLDKPGLRLFDFSEGGPANEVITDQQINADYNMAKAKDLYDNPTISWNIVPSNLKQGSIGDCYILGSLSVVANHPENIKRLMEDKQGDVEVWLCDSGCWKKIVMNKSFPVSNNRPIFASPKDNCIWQMVLEKAFACMYKGYDRLELGHSSVAMGELTGCATEYIELENPVEAWNNILSFLNEKYVITGSSKVTGLSTTTITPKHCYAVLGAKEVTYQNKKIKYINLMNPMSAWAEPPALPQEVAKQLSAQSHDVFWYPFASLLKDFEVLTCCKIKPDLTYSWSRVLNPAQKSNTAIFRLATTPGDSLSISFNHKNLRHYTKQSLESIMKTKYAVTRVVAFTFSKEGSLRVLGYGFHSLHSIRMQLEIDTTDVYLFVDIDYAQKLTDEFTVSASAKNPVLFQREHEVEKFILEGSNKAYLIKLLLYHAALNSSSVQTSKQTPLHLTQHEYKHKTHGPQPALRRLYGQALGYISFVYHNGTKGCTLRETYSPTELKNVVEFLPKNLKNYKLVLPPNHGEVVVLKFGPENNCSHVSRIGTSSELHF